MWQLPCALALGVLLERNEWSLVGIVGVGGVLLLASFLSERRSRDLEAARARREAEERVRLCRDAAIVGGALKLSPREKILLEELDCRTWLDQTVGVIWSTYHGGISGWLETILAGVLDGLTPLGPVDSLTFSTTAPRAASPSRASSSTRARATTRTTTRAGAARRAARRASTGAPSSSSSTRTTAGRTS